MRKVQLAERIGLTAAAISQFEHGTNRPSPATLGKLALTLGVSVDFFEQRPGPAAVAAPQGAFFRSLRSTPQIERVRASARAVLVCELARTLEAYVQLPAVRLPSVPLGEDDEPLQADDAAAAARVELGVAPGPVPNVVRLLEAHGALVMRLRMDDQRVSAFSQWFDGRPLVALGSDRDDAGRSRFDAAHELGHLVMHPEPEAGNAILERQADRFAASFLMPADDIAPQLPPRFDLPRYLELKRTWGVSIAALLFRARDVGRISDSAYRRAVTWMSSAYGRRREPEPLAHEHPVLLWRAAQLAFPSDPVSGLAACARLPENVVREMVNAREPAKPALLADDILRG